MTATTSDAITAALVLCRRLGHDTTPDQMADLYEAMGPAAFDRYVETLRRRQVPDPDDDYTPGTPAFHAYWSGRFRGALRFLLDHPDRDVAERLARETLDAYAARTGQSVRRSDEKDRVLAHYSAVLAEAKADPDLWDRCDARTTGLDT